MAKANVTRKWLKDSFKCLSIPYAGMQFLLYFQSADYYTSGVYGWNFDAYRFGRFCITTGYRNTIANFDADYSIDIHDYDNKARELIENNHDYTEEGYRKLQENVNSLLAEVLTKICRAEVKVY